MKYTISLLFLLLLLSPVPSDAADSFYLSAREAAENSRRVDLELLRLMDEGYQILDVLEQPLRYPAPPVIDHTWGTIAYILGEPCREAGCDHEDHDEMVAYWIVEIRIEHLVGKGYRILQIESTSIA